MVHTHLVGRGAFRRHPWLRSGDSAARGDRAAVGRRDGTAARQLAPGGPRGVGWSGAAAALKKRARAMPRWRPAPAALVRQFEAAIAAVPGAQLRTMFGYPAAVVRGHTFAGMFQRRMTLRLAAADRAELARHPGAQPFEPMPCPPMREYLVAPPARPPPLPPLPPSL